MKSLRHMSMRAASLPLAADDILEFHAARILLLIHECGISGRIDGLTKMAKLDFFIRYPEFFLVAKSDQGLGDFDETAESVESVMVRHHYGPWDKRYYQVLAYLEARRLIIVTKKKNQFQISLGPTGLETARVLAATASFRPLVERLKDLKKVFGAKSGTYLKNMIYRLFDREVAQVSLGVNIR